MIALLSLMLSVVPDRCTVTHYCFNGTTITCSADGLGSHCDSGGNFVRCESWDASGEKVVIYKQCSLKLSDEES